MMNTLLPYLIKILAGTAVITLPYYFLLRNDPNLKLKRFYLLAGILASWLFPLLSLSESGFITTVQTTVGMELPVVNITPVQKEHAVSLNWTYLVFCLYFSGMLLILVRHFVLIKKFHGIKKKQLISRENIVYTDSGNIFSLFRNIYVPEEMMQKDELNMILIHEKAHIQQYHYIDLIIAELNILFTWFNPFSWLISRMIKENHEHLADREVLLSGVNPAHYKAQLVNQSLGVRVFRLGHQFNHSITKQRFIMMKRLQFSKKDFVKFIFLIPFILVALGFVTRSSGQEKTIQGKVMLSDKGKPAFGASVVVKNTENGTIADEKGAFSLNIENDADLHISYVGYQTKLVKASAVAGKTIYLDRKTFNLTPKVETETTISENRTAQKHPEGHNAEKMYIVEDMPKFNGGSPEVEFTKYTMEHIQYPESALKEGITGTVFVQFVVNEEGKVEQIEVVRGVHPLLDQEAMRVVEASPVWMPGLQRNGAVSVQFTFPVKFSLEKKD